MFCIIYGQGCCTAGDVVGGGLRAGGCYACEYTGSVLPGAVRRADVLGMAVCNDTRGYFAVK